MPSFSLEAWIRAITLTLGVAMAGVLLWGSWVSRREKNSQASVRLGVSGCIVLLLVFLAGWNPGPWTLALEAVASGITVLVGLALLWPMKGGSLPPFWPPAPGVDERDIMFSRAELVPGTERFQEHYRRRPEHREPDDAFRKEPGLLSRKASQYHGPGFAAADAAFWTIEQLRPFVEGPQEHEAPAPLSGAGSPDPEGLTRFLKAWALEMGAHSAGVAGVRDYHLYTHVGRGTEYGKAVTLDHPFALALTVEMNKEMVDRAPGAPTVMESAYEYLRSGTMAVQMADLIRRLGFRARAHVDGNYRVICPLVARDAGLGELGRMGLLMTPRLGPRVRIAVVTTDLPLVPDPPASDPATVDFCLRCRKCADACPSRAISFDPPKEDEAGVRRWRIDAEACFTLWTRLGTDCARCMAVCPYSHPDNAFHGLIRWGIRRNVLFRWGAVRMDDLVYGRRPSPRKPMEWMDVGHRE